MKQEFRAVHEGRGGHIEYCDGEQSVRLDIEMMGVGPPFCVYVPELEPEISQRVVRELQWWLFRSGRNWSVMLPSGELVPANRRARWSPARTVLSSMAGAGTGLLLTLLVYYSPWRWVPISDLIFLPAALFNWFFLLGDTGSPEQHQLNVFRYGCLINSILGGLIGLIGPIVVARLKRHRV